MCRVTNTLALKIAPQNAAKIMNHQKILSKIMVENCDIRNTRKLPFEYSSIRMNQLMEAMSQNILLKHDDGCVWNALSSEQNGIETFLSIYSFSLVEYSGLEPSQVRIVNK